MGPEPTVWKTARPTLDDRANEPMLKASLTGGCRRLKARATTDPTAWAMTTSSGAAKNMPMTSGSSFSENVGAAAEVEVDDPSLGRPEPGREDEPRQLP